MLEIGIIIAQASIIIWLAVRVWYLKRKLAMVKILETTLHNFADQIVNAAIQERKQKIDLLDADHLEF